MTFRTTTRSSKYNFDRLWKCFLRQIYSFIFHIFKLNNLKIIHDLYSQCLTQTLSKTSIILGTEGVYISCMGAEKINTHPIQQTLYNFIAIYFLVGDFAIFFSVSSFKLIKDVSHSSDLICWWVIVYRVNLSFS